MRFPWQKKTEKDVHDAILSALYEYRNTDKFYNLFDLLPDITNTVLRTKANELGGEGLIKVVPPEVRTPNAHEAGTLEWAMHLKYARKTRRKRNKCEAKILPKGIKYVNDNHLPEKRPFFIRLKSITVWLVTFGIPIFAFFGISKFDDIQQFVKGKKEIIVPVIDLCSDKAFIIEATTGHDSGPVPTFLLTACNKNGVAKEVKIKFSIHQEFIVEYKSGTTTFILPTFYEDSSQLYLNFDKLRNGEIIRRWIKLKHFHLGRPQVLGFYVASIGSFVDENDSLHNVFNAHKFRLNNPFTKGDYRMHEVLVSEQEKNDIKNQLETFQPF